MLKVWAVKQRQSLVLVSRACGCYHLVSRFQSALNREINYS